MRVLNIILAGFGGQGLISLARVLAEAAQRKGYNVIVAETHGLSQRGGTVVVHVRLGDCEAPLVPPGTADILLAMELIEANRYLYYLNPNGTIVANDYILPPPLPKIQVPTREELVKNLARNAKRVVLVNATREALKLGDTRVANMVLLGAVLHARLLEPMVDTEAVKKAIESLWPRDAMVNIKALEAGSKSYTIIKDDGAAAGI